MKGFIVAMVILVIGFQAKGQTMENDKKTDDLWKIEGNFWYAFSQQGYVQVREFSYQGNRLSLPNDLGMDQWMGLRLGAHKKLRNYYTLDFSLEGFHFRGTHTLPYDLFYNKVKIEGGKGIDISKTQFLRAQLSVTKQFLTSRKFNWGLQAGLVYDRLKFFIQGEIAPDSPGKEIYENFGRQATPFPFIGANAQLAIGTHQFLTIATSGTYIPRFTSWWREGGHMDLNYGTYDLTAGYHRMIQDVELSLSYEFRYIKIFEESREDTNDFELSGSGINLGIAYHF